MNAAGIVGKFYSEDTGLLGQLSDTFQSLLAQAHAVCKPEDCYFYHTMEFDRGEVHEGAWDLRGQEDKYLGYLDFSGQTVLEFGPATGHLSFYLERQGTRVVCFDVPPGVSPELLPLPNLDMTAHRDAGAELARRVRNSWWYAHGRFKSRCKAVYGNIYALPADLGRFDVTVFASILLHLSNPFAALQQAASITDKALIVVDRLQRTPADLISSYMEFSPGTDYSTMNWWAISPGVVVKMFRILGFDNIAINYHRQLHRPHHTAGAKLEKFDLYTVVGQRSANLVPRKSFDFQRVDSVTVDTETGMVIDPAIKLAYLQEELRAIRSSTSWRITRPLRVLGDTWKRWRGDAKTRSRVEI